MAVCLRLATPADAPAILGIYGPVVRAGFASFEAEPPSPEVMADRIRETLEWYPWLVCEEHGRLLGYAYAGAHRDRAGYRWAAEVSVYVHPEAQRRGVGRALYTALLAVLTAQGIVNVYGGIALPNAASVALHEALGFRKVAHYPQVGFKAGAWRDTGWWHRRLRPLEPDPMPPAPLTGLSHEMVAAALAEGTVLRRA